MRHAQGINFDIEGAEVIPQNTARGLIALLKELGERGRERISPHFQISFCNAMLGDFPGLQHAYDIRGLAEVIDFFMPYAIDFVSHVAARLR